MVYPARLSTGVIKDKTYCAGVHGEEEIRIPGSPESRNRKGIRKETGSIPAGKQKPVATSSLPKRRPFLFAGVVKRTVRMPGSCRFCRARTSHRGQPAHLYKPELSLNTEQQNDWFDLYGTVTVGAFSFLSPPCKNISGKATGSTNCPMELFSSSSGMDTAIRLSFNLAKQTKSTSAYQKPVYPADEIGIRRG